MVLSRSASDPGRIEATGDRHGFSLGAGVLSPILVNITYIIRSYVFGHDLKAVHCLLIDFAGDCPRVRAGEVVGEGGTNRPPSGVDA